MPKNHRASVTFASTEGTVRGIAYERLAQASHYRSDPRHAAKMPYAIELLFHAFKAATLSGGFFLAGWAQGRDPMHVGAFCFFLSTILHAGAWIFVAAAVLDVVERIRRGVKRALRKRPKPVDPVVFPSVAEPQPEREYVNLGIATPIAY